MGQVPRICSANPLVVLPCGGERQILVRPAPHFVGVRVVLTIILPEANRANLICRPFAKSAIATAGAGIEGLGKSGHRASMARLPNVRNGSNGDGRNGWKADIAEASFRM